jgi:hypothetical protein
VREVADHFDLTQIFANLYAFNQCRNVFEKEKEKFEKYVSENPEKSKEELVAEGSKVLLDEVLKRYDLEKLPPEMRTIIKLVSSKKASEAGELIGDFVKIYFREHSVGKDGEEMSGEDVIKELAYKYMKSFLLKKYLGVK